MRSARSAATVVGLLDQLSQRALEALQVDVQVDDLVDADRLRRRDALAHRLRDRVLDFLHRAPRDREHDDERHLALRARDLQVETLVLMAENVNVAALQAAPAYRAVVEPSPVADELDDAHRDPILRRGIWLSAGPRCTC